MARHSGGVRSVEVELWSEGLWGRDLEETSQRTIVRWIDTITEATGMSLWELSKAVEDRTL